MSVRKWLARAGLTVLALIVLSGAVIFGLSQARLTHAYVLPS